jgi:chromosome partitioning protein
MKVISIINSKGGVGKTTLTANIASELANRGNRVLMIDTDPQMSLTLSFIDGNTYVNHYQYDKTLRNLFTNYIDHNQMTPLEELIVSPTKVNEKVGNRIDLICSHMDLFNVIKELYSISTVAKKSRQHLTDLSLQTVLKMAIKELKCNYEYVLIDCSPTFSHVITENAIIASDYYLVPIKLDFLSRDGLYEVIKQVNLLITSYNKHASRDRFNQYDQINPRLLGVVTNMVKTYKHQLQATQSKYFREHQEVEGINKEQFLFKAKLHDYPSEHYKAPENLLPVVIECKKTKIKDEFKALVKEMITRIEGMEKDED